MPIVQPLAFVDAKTKAHNSNWLIVVVKPISKPSTPHETPSASTELGSNTCLEDL